MSDEITEQCHFGSCEMSQHVNELAWVKLSVPKTGDTKTDDHIRSQLFKILITTVDEIQARIIGVHYGPR